MESLLDRFKRHEGLRLQRYRDSRGIWTIGYGHNLEAKGLMGIIPEERDLDSDGITEEEALALLQRDVADVMADIRGHLPWFDSLDEARQNVLVDMVFNMGIGSSLRHTGLLGFPHMLTALQEGNWEEAATQLKDSGYYHQVGARAVENEQILKTGEVA